MTLSNGARRRSDSNLKNIDFEANRVNDESPMAFSNQEDLVEKIMQTLFCSFWISLEVLLLIVIGICSFMEV